MECLLFRIEIEYASFFSSYENILSIKARTFDIRVFSPMEQNIRKILFGFDDQRVDPHFCFFGGRATISESYHVGINLK